MLWGERRGNGTIVAAIEPTECPMPQANDLSRCLTALDQDSTLIAVIEMSQSSWLVAGIVPGIERHPAKKLEPDPTALLRLLHRWRAEAERSGRKINRIAVGFEAGRDRGLPPPGPALQGQRLPPEPPEAAVAAPRAGEAPAPAMLQQPLGAGRLVREPAPELRQRLREIRHPTSHHTCDTGLYGMAGSEG